MKKILFILLVFSFFACHDPSSIKVQNNLSKATVRNVEWGSVPICSQIIPGETSGKIKIYPRENYYDIDLPDKFPLKFYIDVNGDLIYLETMESIRLGIEENISIDINDSLLVINPLLEEEEEYLIN